MVKSIQVSLTKPQMKRMDMVSNCGLMAASTKASGRMIKQRASEGLFWLMEMCIKEIGSKTKPTATGNTFMLKERHTKEVGLKTSKKVMERNRGQIIHITKGAILKAKNMDKVHSNGLTVLNISDNGKTTKCIAKANLNGQTAESTKENI